LRPFKANNLNRRKEGRKNDHFSADKFSKSIRIQEAKKKYDPPRRNAAIVFSLDTRKPG